MPMPNVLTYIVTTSSLVSTFSVIHYRRGKKIILYNVDFMGFKTCRIFLKFQKNLLTFVSKCTQKVIKNILNWDKAVSRAVPGQDKEPQEDRHVTMAMAAG
jgi:hypothetical protein